MRSKLLSLCRPAVLLRWVVLVVMFLSAWMTLNYSKLQDYYAARERRNNYRESVARLQKEHEQLTREHAALLGGGFPAEKAIRERLKMVKPGEKVIYIETPADKAAAARLVTVAPPEAQETNTQSPDKLARQLTEAARKQGAPQGQTPARAEKERAGSDVTDSANEVPDAAPAPADSARKPRPAVQIKDGVALKTDHGAKTRRKSPRLDEN